MWLEPRRYALAAVLAIFTLPIGCTMTQSPPLPYLALGDSYTIGEGVEPHERWTEQLVGLLAEDGIALESPWTIARTGWTTDELDSAIDEAMPLGEFGFVSLLIGVNNQYRGRKVAEYGREFEALLRRAIGFAGDDPTRVLVLSIPDWGATPFGSGSDRDLADVSAQLDAYNAIARETTQSLGASWVDITPVSRARGMDADMVAGDGLHPSAAMYRAWALEARPVAGALLTR